MKKRIFFKSFFISLTVAAALFSAIVLFSAAGERQTQSAESRGTQSAAGIKSRDKFSFLLTVSRKKNESPYAFFLICANGERQKIFITRLALNTSADINGEKKILSEEFKKSPSSAVDFLSQAFSADLKYFISADDSSLIKIFESFPPIVLNLKESLNEVDRQKDIYIKIDKGRQVFSPVLLLDFLKCTAFKNPLDCFYQPANALCEFVNQNRENILLKKDFPLSEYLFESFDTNLTAVSLENALPLFSQIMSESSPCEPIAAEGSFKNADTEFRPSLSFKTLISALF